MKKSINIAVGAIMAVVMFYGCAKPTLDENEAARQAIDKMAETTKSELLKEHKELQGELDSAVGYMVTNWKTTKVPLVGGGGGDGVVVDNATKEHVYINVKRVDVGGGYGARSFKVLLVVKDKALLANLKNGAWKFEGGAEVTAGTASTGGSSGGSDSEYKSYMLLDGGGSATVTLRALHSTVDSDLN
ncbi:MAG: hypothetical protein WBF77_02570 [Sulfurimonadaceae bacterium]